jgi:hypothetical protein
MNSLPRNIAGPVVRGSDLWGREADVRHLRELVRKGSVLMAGPRRHGKSSLMYALVDAPEASSTVILLDVEWVQTPDEFLTAMAAELLALDRVRKAAAQLRTVPTALTKWISGILEEVGVGIEHIGELKIRLRQGLSDIEQWPQLAEQMLNTLRALGGEVILILDEFPTMVGNMLDRDQATGIRFLRWFRTFRQSIGTERLKFLLGGSTNIEPRLEALGSEILLGDLQRFRIRPFERNQARAFVGKVVQAEGISMDDEAIEDIVNICRTGVPYYLQVVISECLAESRRSSRRLSAQDVKAIYDERVVGPINRHLFSHYQTRLRLHYGELEEPARVVLCSLCAGPKLTADLRATLAASGRDASCLERLLVLLEGDYYVSRDGDSWRFEDGLLSDWWTRNSVPPRTRS